MFQNFFKHKLLPAVTLTDTESALSVAEALLKGGLNVMEVTFRTPVTASAISAITKNFPEMIIGAGTILSPEQISTAINAGAQFGLAPGLNKQVIRRAEEQEFPFIPGIMTPSEIEQALDAGFKTVKVFPVSNLGGPSFIQRIESAYRHTGIQFLPMGGIKTDNLKSYIRYKSVIGAGGSWLAPKELIEQREFKKITERIRHSLELIEGTLD